MVKHDIFYLPTLTHISRYWPKRPGWSWQFSDSSNFQARTWRGKECWFCLPGPSSQARPWVCAGGVPALESGFYSLPDKLPPLGYLGLRSPPQEDRWGIVPAGSGCKLETVSLGSPGPRHAARALENEAWDLGGNVPLIVRSARPEEDRKWGPL